MRGAIPGETVTARVTGEGPKGRYLFAETVEVLEPSPDRVEAPCRFAADCGGCDFQHISMQRQRSLKSEVLTEQLQRLGGIADQVPVPVLPPVANDSTRRREGESGGESSEGLGWRTRMRFAADEEGRWGLRRHRSHDVLPVDECLIATPSVNRALGREAPGDPGTELLVVEQPAGAVTQRIPDDRAVEILEVEVGRQWHMQATDFWQAHRDAATTLVGAVAPHVLGSEQWWDLYCGVGLFAGALAGPGQRVVAVEGHRSSARQARNNLSDLPGVRVVTADVGRWLERASGKPGVVVLDPPRSGAGKGVVAGLTATSAHTIVHVACDPASLGRDVGLYRKSGWDLRAVTGYDLFPMTHHVEAVAVLTR